MVAGTVFCLVCKGNLTIACCVRYDKLPQNAERFKEKQEQKEMEVHDELNEKLRNKFGRIAYLIGLSVYTYLRKKFL